MYWVKHLHVFCVILSIGGFMLRAWWRIRNPQDKPRHWVRIVPHVVDSTLFFSGLAMVMYYRWYPTEHDWLAAKLVALVLYIVLGAVALRRSNKLAAAAAVITFFYIVSVALSKHPLPW